MKNIYLTLAFACFVAFTSFSQSPEWKWQNPLPTGNSLRDIQFLDSQIGWAVGSFGTILKSTNGGQNWESQSSGTTNDLFSVHFSDAQTGWAVGSGGTILKTSNGGQTWQAQSSGTYQVLYSVHFIDAQTGWAVGNYGTILKTSNGGNTWTNQSSGTAQYLRSIQFTDNQTGWVVGSNGTILKTSNGGQTWQAQSSGTTNNLWSVHFSNAQTGWAVGVLGTILKTINSGQSWLAQSSGTTQELQSVHFNDEQTGWAVGSSGTILKTSNGGQIWQVQTSGTTRVQYSVNFTNAQTGWTVGVTGIILKTSNGGQSWQAQSNGTTNAIFSVHFIDNQTGWAVGYAGTILKTSNGGQSWKEQTSGTTQWLNSVHFSDAQTGWVAGYGGTILKTSNGGENWQAQTSGTTIALLSVHFNDAQTGWTSGGVGTILKTSNGGNSWHTQNTGAGIFHSIHFIDAQTGWAVGGSSPILKTSNGGQSWQVQNSGTSKYLYSCYFTNSLFGWAVGESGTILKTNNGGQSWQAQSSGTTRELKSVYFSDTQTGRVVGQGGLILKTSNGGQSWQVQNSGTFDGLFSVYFSDAKTGWAVGGNGTILHYQGGLSPEVPSSLITGKLFEKTGSDCNNTATGIPYGVIKAEPGPYYGVANLDGNYKLRVPLADTAATFTLSPLGLYSNAFQSTLVCPPSGQISVSVDTIPDTLSGNNFGFEITPCHHLDVQLSSNRRRRCFVNTTSVSYYNHGASPANNAYVLVEFPRWVQPLSASHPFVAVNDSIWRFNLGNVAPGTGGSFTIRDSVLCGNVGILGLSQCTKATIFPAPDCPPPSNWSGAEVSVSGKCENGLVKLGIYNKTNVNMADSVLYSVFLDSILVRQEKVKLAAGDSLKLSVVPNGMGVFLSVAQVANHPSQDFVTASVEGCGFMPLAKIAVATHLPVGQAPNSKTQCLPIIGAYDPNDKQVFPIGFTNQNIIAPNTRLEYLVRFQNTGNDTAFTVFVIDTLDQNLNVESFEMGAASHSYELSMQTTKSGKTFLRWQFNNILLPDSNTNEPASNGFIQFRISPKGNLALGTKVRNHAEIYFDFNPPIITNQTLSTFDVIRFVNPALNGNVTIITQAGKLTPARIGASIYPNPVQNGTLYADFKSSGSLQLLDAQGRSIFSQAKLSGKQALPIQLKPGLYIAQLKTEQGNVSVKVVVE